MGIRSVIRRLRFSDVKSLRAGVPGARALKLSRIRGSDHKLFIVEPENPEYGFDNIVPLDLNEFPINAPNRSIPLEAGCVQ